MVNFKDGNSMSLEEFTSLTESYSVEQFQGIYGSVENKGSVRHILISKFGDSRLL